MGLPEINITFTTKASTLISRSGRGVVALILEDATNTTFPILDRYEGYPNFYTKEQVTASTDKGCISGMTYVMTKEYADKPKAPSVHYFGIIIKGYEDNNLPLPHLIDALSLSYKELGM